MWEHLPRRILTRSTHDIEEQQGSNLIVTSLDWEQACAKVQHEKLYVTLQRSGFRQHFFVSIDVVIATRDSLSNMNLVHPQQNGQRHGLGIALPLFSPCLCVLVMSLIDHDISHILEKDTISSRKAGIEFDTIDYTDDTVRLATNMYAANKKFWAVERIS